MKKRSVFIKKFREYFMLDIGLDDFIVDEKENLSEDTSLLKIIEEFRKR